MIEYSIPYMMGWYALGDKRLAEENLFTEAPTREHFESSEV